MVMPLTQIYLPVHKSGMEIRVFAGSHSRPFKVKA